VARVAFVERAPASGFMAGDLAAIESHFDATVLRYERRPTIRFVLETLRAAWRDDAVYAFFASEHALLPALVFGALRKPFVVAPAGYDYANLPEHGYGLAANGRGWLPRLLARRAAAIVTCSRAATAELLALVPEVEGRVRLAPLGADPRAWADPTVDRNPQRVVTMGYVSLESWSRKGVDRFVAAAAADPDREYVLAGRVDAAVRSTLDARRSPNLTVTGFLDHDEQRRLLWSAGVYTQLSWHESFGMALLEAMLCGCVPVVTGVPALQEVAGPWAVTSSAPEEDIDAIIRAASASVDRAAMQADTAQRFPAAARADAVTGALDGALSARRGRASRPRLQSRR